MTMAAEASAARILVVDDEKSIRRTLGEFLRAEGYAVLEAANAEEAERHLREADVDVVVTDILLPRVTGVELLQRIHTSNPCVQVVVMTGEPTVETAAESLRAGASDYLLKPIGKADILRTVGKVARMKQLEDTRRRLEAENLEYRENLERLVEERTAQWRASEARASELFRFNQGALDALADHIGVLDGDGTLLAVNRSWREFATANPSSALHAGVGDNYWAVCAAAAGAEAPAAGRALEGLRAVARGEQSGFAMEYECHSTTERRWFALRATRFAGGEPLRLVVAHEDITERRRAEEQLRKLVRAVEQSPVSIVITDPTGNIEYVNPRFTQVSGYTLEEVRGRNPRILKSGATADTVFREMWETLVAGREWRGEFQNRRKDGTVYWEAASISSVRDADGRITHYIAVKEDITQKKLTEAKLLRAQRVESVGSLASGIAHDLNNILAPVLMCSSMLRLEEDAEERRELIQTIESSAMRAVDIVRQLLGFARGRDGQREPVQVRHLVRDMAKIARETFPRSIQITEVCAADLWPVRADATQLHQVLLNLCVNARDAMPSGGRLVLRAENVVLDEHYAAMHPEAAAGPHVRIQVEDSGFGIPEAIRDSVFEAFFTTKGEGHGTGLGLSTVQGIVRSHGGFIEFTTREGRGTTFEVHLPAAPASPDGPGEAARSAGLPPARGELILVVDDEPNIREAVRRTLERHGYQVLAAQEGIEAISQFTRHRDEVRAVVTDVMMPLMDGITLCRTVRRLNPKVPLIVSSGGLCSKEGGQTLRHLEELRIRHILHKPHTADLLLRTLGEALHGAG